MTSWALLSLATGTEITNMPKNTILSIGYNRKLAKSIGILNQPEGATCPGATQLCKSVCYAGKSGRMYKSARAKRFGNLIRSQSAQFVDNLVAEIRDHELRQVRFHEAGDVYNQAYLDKLYTVCHMCPDVRFLMYTKSFHLSWTGQPSNLALYWSIDKTTTQLTPSAGRVAYLVAKGDNPPAGHVTCQHTKDKHYCGDECRICWEGNQDVYFLQH